MDSAALQAYLNGPASTAPNGTVVDLDNPPRNNTSPLVLATVCIVLTTLAVVGRAYSRLFVVKRLQAEDYLGLLAFVGFVINIGYSLVLLFSKSAILLEWVNIFVPKGTRNTFYWSARVMMVANILLYTSSIIVALAGCQPLALFWDFWLSGHCINRKSRDTVNAAFNVVMDVIILLLPQLVIWNLHMTSTRKTGVCVVFSVGLIVIVTSVGRLVGIVTMDYPTSFAGVFDTPYQFSGELEWIIAEVTCVMLVFCVPALPRIISEPTIQLTARITQAWQSWTRLGRNSRASESQYSDDRKWDQVNLPHHVPRANAAIPKSQQRVHDEENLWMTNNDTETTVEVLELANTPDGTYPGYYHAEVHSDAAQKATKHPMEAGILKTIQFDQHDGDVS
ncbi:hypothetical protein SLS53_004558 [Cytospora paraplurivora]|uniref:Rhodopsin domain-containing protein n=1 Tax=Cytospora paraplurivora TaxID=2898453 RepID=A0AAN9U8P3_9PEZI